MKIRLEITGTTPLMMHNDRLSDPSNPITMQIKELTAKKTNKTIRDEDDISKLEWMGSAYTDENNEIVMPCANIIRCLRDAGAITRKSKDIARALSPLNIRVPLLIDGPRKLDELWGQSQYIDKRMVKVKAGRIKRTRPIFPKWALVADFDLLDTVMNPSALENIIEIAGASTGLGDARVLGYGRFKTKITKSK